MTRNIPRTRNVPSELIAELGETLQARGQRLAIAESVTCGNICALLGSISGTSNWLAGGIVAYNLEQKVRLLKVDRQLAASTDCVSGEVARQMALGVQQLFEADVALAITGYAEPSPAQNINHPLAHSATLILSPNGPVIKSHNHQAPGQDRTTAQLDFALQAIHSLAHHLTRPKGRNPRGIK